jgi:hypothetical protein
MLRLRTNLIGGILTAWRASVAFNFLGMLQKRSQKQMVPVTFGPPFGSARGS